MPPEQNLDPSSSDGTPPPIAPPAGPEAKAPEPKAPETPTPEEGKPSTPPEQSPPDKPEGDKPEPTAEEAAAAAALETARAVVPTEASAYAVNLDAEAKTALGLGDGEDPIVKGITETFAKAGKTQGQLDDFLADVGELAKAGLFAAGAFDPAAELAKLGENGEARRREVEIFAEGLKNRGDGFDEEMHGELMSLSPTAAGVKLVEYFRKLAGPNGEIAPPVDTNTATSREAAQAEAEKLRRDPRYESDRKFRKDADAAFMAAHAKG